VNDPLSNRDFEADEIQYEDAMAERYDRDYHEPAIMKRHDEDFATFVAQHYRAGDRVLDLGCGPGSLWSYWTRHFTGNTGIIGVDISPKMVKRAKSAWPDGDFRVGTFLEIPVESATVDLVIASSTLHHLPDALLPQAFAEIRRVLVEHGTLVGREPVGVGRLADEPGWLSGAIMNFRHMVSRLTHTREYAEPENGPHHHAYDPREFFGFLSEAFAPRSLTLRHPFSSYVSRCDDPLVESIAMWFDDWLSHQRGQEFYYAASNNFANAAEVARCIRKELETDPHYDKQQFLALLQSAAELIEREFRRPGRGPR
jgi:ubiquinone/menaquinone biosynthesis C-methylase UbiE